MGGCHIQISTCRWRGRTLAFIMEIQLLFKETFKKFKQFRHCAQHFTFIISFNPCSMLELRYHYLCSNRLGKVIQLINWRDFWVCPECLPQDHYALLNLFTFAIFWRRTGKHRQEKEKVVYYGHTTGCCSVFDKSVPEMT